MLKERLLNNEDDIYSNAPVRHSNDEIELQYSAPSPVTDNDDSNQELLPNKPKSDKNIINGHESPIPIATHPLSGHISISLYILFMIIGFGPSWVLLDAMFIQLPYYQNNQPEGSSLASKMTLSGSLPIALLPIYFLIINNINPAKISFRILLYILFITNIGCCILIASTYHIAIDNVSIFIYLVTFMSSFNGHLQTTAIIPWMTSINYRLPPAVLSGANTGSLLTALIGLLQRPGNDDPLFKPGVFYSIFAVLFIISFCAFCYLDYKYLRNIENIQKHHREFSLSVDDINHQNKINKINTKIGKINNLFSSTFSFPSWWKLIWKYCLLNSYIQVITWIFIRSTIPFAASHIKGGGTETEQYIIELSYVTLLSGSILSLFIGIKKHKYFIILTIIYTIFGLIFFVIVIDNRSNFWKFYGSNDFLIAVVCSMRFLDGYISPLIFKNVAILYPDKAHVMNQWIGAIEKVAIFIGVWLTYSLVQTNVIGE